MWNMGELRGHWVLGLSCTLEVAKLQCHIQVPYTILCYTASRYNETTLYHSPILVTLYEINMKLLKIHFSFIKKINILMCVNFFTIVYQILAQTGPIMSFKHICTTVFPLPNSMNTNNHILHFKKGNTSISIVLTKMLFTIKSFPWLCKLTIGIHRIRMDLLCILL